MSQTVLVMGTSAPSDRKAYSRDLLDCLCYPIGHTAQFSYRARWVEPGLFTRKISNAGIPSLVVLCDGPSAAGSQFDFVPLRHVTLLAVEPRSVLETGQQDENTYITLRFVLGPFVQLSPKTADVEFRRWDEWIKGGTPCPFPRGHPSESSARFVFERSGFEEQTKSDQQVSWRELAARISRTQSLADSYLFRVAGVESRDKHGRSSEVAPTNFLEQQGYDVSSPGSYVVKLLWQQSTKPAPMASSSSENAIPIGPLTSSFGRHTEGSLLIRVRRVYEEEMVNIVLTQDNEGVNSPVANLLFRLSPPKWLLPAIVLLLSLGALMTGVTKDAIAELTSSGTWANAHGGAIAWLLKATGAIAVGTGGYLGFRRLPKGIGL